MFKGARDHGKVKEAEDAWRKRKAQKVLSASRPASRSLEDGRNSKHGANTDGRHQRREVPTSQAKSDRRGNADGRRDEPREQESGSTRARFAPRRDKATVHKGRPYPRSGSERKANRPVIDRYVAGNEGTVTTEKSRLPDFDPLRGISVSPDGLRHQLGHQQHSTLNSIRRR